MSDFNWVWITSLDFVALGANNKVTVALNLNTFGWTGEWPEAGLPEGAAPDFFDSIRFPWDMAAKIKGFDFWIVNETGGKIVSVDDPSIYGEKVTDTAAQASKEFTDIIKKFADSLPAFRPDFPHDLPQFLECLKNYLDVRVAGEMLFPPPSDPAHPTYDPTLFNRIRKANPKAGQDLIVPLTNFFADILQSNQLVFTQTIRNAISKPDTIESLSDVHRANGMLLRDAFHFPDGRYRNLDGTSLELPHDTWSGCLGGLSHKGYPLAHGLGLVCLCELDKSKLDIYMGKNYTGKKSLAVFPRFETQANPEPGKDGSFVQANLFPDLQTPVQFHIGPLPIPKDWTTLELPNFIGQAGEFDAADMDNWRAHLPTRLGEFMDLFRWYSEAVGCPLDPARATPVPMVAEKILAMIHDHADMGFRQPPQSRDPHDRLSGTLAWEALKSIALPDQPNALRDIYNILDGIIAENNGSAFVPDFKDWAGLVTKAIGKPPAARNKPADVTRDSLQASGTANAYPNLRELIDPDGAPKTDGFTIDKWNNLVEEVEMLLQDEEVLLALFIRQWDDLLSKNDKLAKAFEAGTTDHAPTVSHHRDALRAWVQSTNIPLRNWYGNGLAGEYWEDRAGTDLANDSKTSGDRIQDERDKAREVLQNALIYYRDSLWNNGTLARAKGRINFLRPSNSSATPWKMDSSELDDAALSTILDGTKASWVDRLVGKSGDQKVTTPPPLPIPLPSTADWEDNDPARARYAGVLVMARRVKVVRNEAAKKDEERDATSWCCLTIGDLAWPDPTPHSPKNVLDLEEDGIVHENAVDPKIHAPWPPLFKMEVVALPIPLSRNFGLPQTLMNYTGRPFGVHLWENYAAWSDPTSERSARTGDDEPAGPNLPLIRRQLLGSDSGWGPVPGLRYDPNMVYEFLFIPVHRTGVLPTQFRKTLGSGGADLCILADATPCNQILSGLADAAAQKVRVKNYVRRVPIGAPRLASPTDRSVFVPPQIPTEVNTICADILEADQAAPGLQSPTGNMPRPGGNDDQNSRQAQNPPRPPAHCILLWGDPGTATSKIEFGIRPPATDIENWKIWQESVDPAVQPGPESAESFQDTWRKFIADTDFLVKELNRENVDLNKVPEDRNPSSLLDDPAVCGFIIRTRNVFPLPSEKKTRFYFPVSIPEPGAVTKAVETCGSNTSQFVAKCGPDIRPVVQQFAADAGSKLPARLKIVTSTPPAASPTGNEIGVESGTILEVEIVPCIPCISAASPDRFGIYKEAVETPAGAGCSRPIESSALRIWIESAAKPTLEKLNPEDVWKALTLCERGELSGTKPTVPRLEVGLRPTNASRNQMEQWCLYSNYIVEIQPWRWAGLPEDNHQHLAGLLSPGAKPNEADPATLDSLIEGEMASFSERTDQDAIAIQPGIRFGDQPDAKPVAVQPRINFAQWLLDHQKDSLTEWPVAVLHQENGPQEVIPRHYRVRLRLLPRYRGLKDGYDQELSTEHRWTGNVGECVTHHRRITFRGKLAEPLRPPVISVVIPLLEEYKDEPRPGFVALSWEPLRSPFYRLKAQIQWATLDMNEDVSSPIHLSLPELGPVPRTSGGALSFPNVPADQWCKAHEIDGKAFGITFEREAGNPFFARAGFYFDCPLGKDKNYLEFQQHDWIAKINFSWQIDPPYVMDDPVSSLRSSPTGNYQVLLLAPFSHLEFTLTAGRESLPLGSVQFSITDDNVLSFFSGGESVTPLPPIFDPNKRHEGDTPVAALIFAAWTSVPDFFNRARSKILHSLYIISKDKPAVQIAKSPFVDSTIPGIAGATGGLKPENGNFLLLFTRQANLAALLEDIEKKPGTSFDCLRSFLFPDPKGKAPLLINVDSSGMITRISSPLSAMT